MSEKIKWEDVTSYSREEKRIPRSWELKIDNHTRILVTRRHMLDGWFVLCFALGMSAEHKLKAEDIKDAKVEAFRLIAKHVRTLNKKLKALKEEYGR